MLTPAIAASSGSPPATMRSYATFTPRIPLSLAITTGVNDKLAAPEQAKVLIESAGDDRFLALWVTALATGLRQGELLGLLWADIDLEDGRVTVSHTLGMVDGHLALLEPKTERSRRTVMAMRTILPRTGRL